MYNTPRIRVVLLFVGLFFIYLLYLGMELETIIALGERLGYKDDSLQEFVQKETERIEKKAIRDQQREDRRLEREKTREKPLETMNLSSGD